LPSFHPLHKLPPMWRYLSIIPFTAVVMTPLTTAGEPSEISDQAVATLQRSVDASYREARKTFLFNEDFAETDIERNPFTLAVNGWKRRQAACADNRCRLTELTAQLDRLNFANGNGRKPVPGMPWRTGSFALSATGMAGDLSILPVGDGSIVASFTTFATRGRDWDCAGFTATGTLSQDGQARMTLYDDTADQGESVPVFRLRTLSPTSVRLQPDTADGYDDICRTGMVFGIYKTSL
jgi:hypothetical protein